MTEFQEKLTNPSRAQIRRRLRHAEWGTPDGRTGEVCFQLRHRARVAEWRSILFFFVLIIVVGAGIVFYLVRPLLQDQDRIEARVHRAQLETRQADMLALDSRRNALRDRAGRRLIGAIEPLETNFDGYLNNVAIVDGGTTVIATGYSVIRSTDLGQTWEINSSITSQHFGGAKVAPDGKTVLVPGNDGVILRSVNLGRTWETIQSGVSGDIDVLAIAPDGKTVVALGTWDNNLIRSTDLGQTWEPIQSGIESFSELLVIAPDGVTVLAGGEDGSFARSIDLGRTWTVTPYDSDSELMALAIAPDGKTVLAAGRDGLIIRSVNLGETWAIIKEEPDAGYNDLKSPIGDQ